MRKHLTIAVAAIALSSMSSAALAAADQDYLVRVRIQSGANVIAQPAVQVRAGHSAAIEVGESYSISVMVTPDSEKPGNVLLTSDVTVKAEQGTRKKSSTVSLRPEEKMALDFEAQAGADPVQVEITATSLEGR